MAQPCFYLSVDSTITVSLSFESYLFGHYIIYKLVQNSVSLIYIVPFHQISFKTFEWSNVTNDYVRVIV